MKHDPSQIIIVVIIDVKLNLSSLDPMCIIATLGVISLEIRDHMTVTSRNMNIIK